ncbi:MAG: transcription termination factor Rho [Candidatus Brocadiae bacterium]|nr:transcription termination factor Rho [Candidatus Brocadiia bacterium]
MQRGAVAEGTPRDSQTQDTWTGDFTLPLHGTRAPPVRCGGTPRVTEALRRTARAGAAKPSSTHSRSCRPMAELVKGILTVGRDGNGMLRDPAHLFRKNNNRIIVPRNLVRRFRLAEGALVEGSAVEDHRRGHVVDHVRSVCGLAADQFVHRTPFDRLVSIDPDDRFHIGRYPKLTMRVMDLFAPIGRGTRGIIVSPPKAGKTTILEDLANAILTVHPTTRVLALLIDERPEEVTMFRRATEAEVWASNMDQPYADHVALVRLCLDHVRCELECGRDIVVLMDSMTRMARAFNVEGSGSGRTLTGGLDASAMQVPRRFFGLARNCEGGGSVTVIATALVDTGSRMDNLIFEEFKGTGNSEIVLDRELAELRIFPAINIKASGTRREEKLYAPEELEMVHRLRRVLADQTPVEAMTHLLAKMTKTESNEEFLASLPGFGNGNSRR